MVCKRLVNSKKWGGGGGRIKRICHSGLYFYATLHRWRCQLMKQTVRKLGRFCQRKKGGTWKTRTLPHCCRLWHDGLGVRDFVACSLGLPLPCNTDPNHCSQVRPHMYAYADLFFKLQLIFILVIGTFINGFLGTGIGVVQISRA